jgi:hypothetical protein
MSTSAGGALAFLNQGTAPSASSNYSQSSTQLPSWYTDYTQQILNSAAQFAAQPYQTYQGPRIAGQTDNTTQAQNASAGVGATAQGTTQAAQNLIQSGANQNNPLAAAQPYLNTGTDPTYNTVQNYMNPYNQDVTSAISNAANTNFNNYTMPALQSGIIGSGNITGSSTEGTNLMENAEQQNEQNITNAQSQALQSGYTGSLGAAQSGAANALTAANTAGNLNTAGAQTAIGAGSALANTGAQNASTQIAAQQNQNTMGLQQQGQNQSNLNLAYQDYLNQLNYPMTQASAMQSALSGIQVPTGQVNYNYGTGINGANGSATSGTVTSPLSSLFGTATGAAAGSTTNNGVNSTNPGTLTTAIPS